MFYKSSRATLINAVMRYVNIRSNVSKLEIITSNFTKSRTPSEVVWKNFIYLQNSNIEKSIKMAASGDNFFSKYSSMAVSQRQL